MTPDDLIAASKAEEQQTWLTVKEYADLKRVSHETVKRWIRRGLIAAERTGPRGHWRVAICRGLLPTDRYL